MKEMVNVFWFRRDLRIEDNAGLYHALQNGKPVIPLFIFDSNILEKLDNKADRRVAFIHDAITHLQESLTKVGSSMFCFHGKPAVIWEQITKKFEVENVFTNHDYEPYALERDADVKELLEKKNIAFHTYKDQVIFEKQEVVKDDGKPYTVFTPYSRKWKSLLSDDNLKAYPIKKYATHFYQCKAQKIPSLKEMGFIENDQPFPSQKADQAIIQHYAENRDFPGIRGTSKLGVHLRFGTISIRQLASNALANSPVFLNELIWRDFYHMILWNFPQVGKGAAFKPAYEHIAWRKDNGEFEKWCKGQTGYPIVDAGMRELNETGFMHNRIRMVTASFLCKHLLLDWRLGEAYFAEKLLDFDLAANNGGWQWAAGSGCDAAPYFRIFNPYLQTKKFDPDLTYIKKWVPEFQEFDYPKPIVDHEYARKRCLEVYSNALRTTER
jgi:deoxyribodipyrimidine photo-lyase